MNKLLISSATAIATLGFVGTTEQVQAASFFGTDTDGTAEQAQTDFLNATGAGSDYEKIDFEGDAGETAPLSWDMGSNGIVNLEGTGQASTAPGYDGGVGWIFQGERGNVEISFSKVQTSFGIWGFDFGDPSANGQFSLKFQNEGNGNSWTEKIPYQDARTPNDSENLFFGWNDPNQTFTKVTFLFEGSNDTVLVDNMLFPSPGSSEEPSTSVPEPGTSAFWLGVIGVGTILYRRKSKSNIA